MFPASGKLITCFLLKSFYGDPRKFNIVLKGRLIETPRVRVKQVLFKSLKPTLFVFFFFMISCLSIFASELIEISPWMQFERLSIKDGLSQSSGNCLLQDKQGFLWIGTEDGLNRYDGIRFKVFRPQEGNDGSLSDGYILSLHEDRKGNIWIGTLSGGLNLYDRQHDKFIHYFYQPGQAFSLPPELFPLSVQVIHEDQQGHLWLGTSSGLVKFDPFKGDTKLFQHNPQFPSSLIHNSVLSLAEDKQGYLWIGTEKGLNVLDLSTGEINQFILNDQIYRLLANQAVRCLYIDSSECLWAGTDEFLACYNLKTREVNLFRPRPNDPFSLSSGYIRTICEDERGVFWIGTYGRGLNLYVRKQQKFYHILNRPDDESSLPNNYINYIMQDRTGVIWIGTFGGGIAKYCEPIKKKFIHINQETRGGLALSANIVFAILEDSRGQLWVGTYGGGLDCLDREKRIRINYRHQPGNPYSLGNNNIRCLLEDRAGFIWIGTYEGLERFDPRRRIFAHFRHDPQNPASLSHNYIRALLEDEQGFLWVGTMGGGVDRYDPRTGYFKHFRNDPSDPYTLSDDGVTSLLLDQDGYLWVGTSQGLNKLERNTGHVVRYIADPEDPESLSNNRILCLYQDTRGRLWIGTYGGGLNLFDEKSGKFRVYQQKDGLPNDVVYGIVEDDRGKLWISTNHGLCCFDPDKIEFRNYDVSDGLQSNEFNSQAVFKNKKGEIFFGGVNGLNIFNPEVMPFNRNPPPVVMTGLRVLYQPILVQTTYHQGVLSEAIEVARELTFSPHHRVVTFEFAALDFVAPEKNQYAFKLEGFDEDWRYVGTQSSATYTNLPPGRYSFRVKAANNDNVWNEEGLSLRIRMKPAYWQTWWFKVILGLMVIGLGLVVHFIRTQAIREKKRELERINLQLEEEVKSRKQAERELKELTNELEKRVIERTSDLIEAKNKLEEAKNKLEKEFIQREKISAELRHSLEEKEVLLQEIHHRIKNNMQIVSSMITLQMRNFKSEQVQEALKTCLSRLRTMALVHEKLYQQKLFTTIDFKDYTSGLIEDLRKIHYDQATRIKVKLKVDKLHLDITKAIPCGLILNELLTNCFKHAFPVAERPNGLIEVTIKKKKEGRYELIVADNGRGLRDKTCIEKPSSLGLRIVNSLVQQLEGKIRVDSGPQGTRVNIIF